MGVPQVSSSEHAKHKRNRTIYQVFEQDLEVGIDYTNERNREIRISESNQVVFQNQGMQLEYTRGLYEDALACGNDGGCFFVDKEGDGFGRENYITDLYHASSSIQDTSGITFDISGERVWDLRYLTPLGDYYKRDSCDTVPNYLEYTTISGGTVTRHQFNMKYPLALHV